MVEPDGDEGCGYGPLEVGSAQLALAESNACAG